MPSITIYQTSQVELTAIEVLLKAAGLASDGHLPPADAPPCLNPHPVLLVILYEALESDKDFEPAMMAAVGSGRRIIGIWPKGSGGEAPAAFKKYSSDQVIWDAEHIRKAICGVGEPVYETAAGSPQTAPQTNRNCN